MDGAPGWLGREHGVEQLALQLDQLGCALLHEVHPGPPLERR